MVIGMEIQRGMLLKLFVPIFFETLLLMLSGIVDILMLPSVPNGVGAVGTANTYISMFFIALTVVSCGMIAVAGTYLFGLVLRWNVLGAMFALTLDECCRALLLFFLWMSRRWQRTSVVAQEAEPDSPVSA